MRLVLLAPLALAALAGASPARATAGKVLYVNSYHRGLQWSDGEEDGAIAVLRASGVEHRVVYMDTKRHPEARFRRAAAASVRAEIERFEPDVVIVADDPAVELVLAPSYRDAKLPFVFCGVNGDGAVHGLPYRNTTGMYEVTLVNELVDALREYARGGRVGLLFSDNETSRNELPFLRKQLGARLATERMAKTFAEWKDAYLRMQHDADILVVGHVAGILGWDEAAAAAFVAANARIPSGTGTEAVAPLVLLGFTKVPEEQGTFAAKSALRILAGVAPSAIPPGPNRQTKVVLNVKLASKVGIVFKPALVRNAQVLK